jgi:magnesium transporter
MRSTARNGIAWHDDTNPTEEELRVLQKQYHFHDLDIEDCLSQHERPKIEEYEDYLFLVFHIPYKRAERILKEEVNIFLGQDFLITIHQGNLPVFNRIWSEVQDSEEKRREYLQQGTGYFLYELMQQLFEEGFPIVDAMTKDLRTIEDDLFEKEEEVDVLRDILALQRNIITMRSILLPQRAVIALLEHKNRKFVPEQLGIYFDNILDAIERQWSLLDTAKEMSEVFQITHRAWLNHRTTNVIRILTIISVTLLPLNFLTGLYGMNVALPLQVNPYAFITLVSIMVTMFTATLGYFTWKRWL